MDSITQPMSERSRCGRALAAALAMAWLSGAAGEAAAQNAERRVIVNPNAAQVFATIPAGLGRTEGITANPQTGDIFVGTSTAGMMNVLLRFDRNGTLTGQLPVGTAPVLGLAFNTRDSKVYMARPGGAVMQPSRIQRVPATFGGNTPVENVLQVPLPAPGPAAAPGATPVTGNPNGLVFRESDGALFFSDSMQQLVFAARDPSMTANTCPNSSDCVSLALRDPLITPAVGIPQAGANGLAFSSDEKRLFVANTANDQIIAFDLSAGPGAVARGSILVQDINGADGLIRGPGNTLVVTANRADQVVILDATTGRPQAELGEFLGIDASGAPLGLSTPASVTLVGGDLFVTNLSAPSADAMASPETEITRFTIARIPIPPALRQAGAAAPAPAPRAPAMPPAPPAPPMRPTPAAASQQ